MPDIAISPEVLRQRRLKRGAAIAIPAAALVALLAWALARPAAGPAVQRSDLWISTVARGPLPIVVSAAGAFQPIEQRWITAASPGVVEEVRVLPGDRVEPNTVLAVLTNPAVDSDLAQARANLASAKAQRASLHAQLISQMLTLQGQLATDQAEAKTAAVRERAERSLVDSHIVSILDYTGTRMQAIEYARLVVLANQQIAAFRQSMAAQEQAAVANVAALRAVLDNSRQQVEALSVTAGMQGVVQDVAVHAGQTLKVGGGIARVAGVKDLKATLQVPASEAGEVAIGQSVTLQLATDVAQNLRGRVTRVSPAVSNGSVDVDVLPQGSLPSDVRPNLAVTGNIHIANIRQATYIQRPAYAGPDSGMTLYRLIDDGRAAVPVSVRFGAASDQYIQVLGGLEPGDRVIVSDTSSFNGEPKVAVR
ncbi:MAG: HlyD family efflux transporter periplasmic adaptor subunit [Steroidobacteraceae bacterium]